MSNLRWILLFAGFAILLLLYFSGRPRKTTTHEGQGRLDPDDLDNHLERSNAGLMPAGATEMPYAAPQANPQGNLQSGFHDHAYQGDPLLDAGGGPGHDVSGTGVEMNQYTGGYAPHQAAVPQPAQADPRYLEAAHGFSDMDPADMVRPGGGYADSAMQPEAVQYAGHPADLRLQYADEPAYEVPSTAPVEGDPGFLTVTDTPVAQTPANPAPTTPAPTTLGSKLDAFSARFTSRRKKAAAASKDTAGEESDSPMVILLHVAAPEGQLIDGQLLLQVFEQRRYHFGEKNIFHSLHQGKTVFSIAKMVEPGFFDVNDISSFETPGLLLILQLPGPVAGEAAFEVLISEARELSDALGCRVLDSKRSTLSRQTTQHLRESVSNYVHRQKYFKKASAS